MTAAPSKRVCWVTTTPFIVNAFLRPHLEALACRYDVTLALNLDDGYPLRAIEGLARVAAIPIWRKVSPLRDFIALFTLIREMSRGGYDAVHTFAPKAGLLGMLAARLSGIPVRLHTFQGEVWASRGGPMRALLKTCDWLIARLATHVLVVGNGERSFLEEEGVLAAGRGVVLADGSVAGVDAERFRPDPEARSRLRAQLDVGETDLMFLYLGRLLRDKGVLDLAAAFQPVGTRFPDAVLVFVGPDEGAITEAIRERAGSIAGRLRFAGYTARPQEYLAAADVVCVPSYREGFSTVILEAAACAVPSVASRIYGTQDTIVDGVTGRYFRAGDLRELELAMLELATDGAMRERMGRAGRELVLRRYRAEIVVKEMVAFYQSVLGDEK